MTQRNSKNSVHHLKTGERPASGRSSPPSAHSGLWQSLPTKSTKQTDPFASILWIGPGRADESIGVYDTFEVTAP
jgi:hypothetical protein